MLSSEFFEARILGLNAEIEYAEKFRVGLEEAYKANITEKEEAEEILLKLRQEEVQQREQIVIKRQTKILEEDLTKTKGPIDDAYAKSMLCSATARRGKTNFDQSAFTDLLKHTTTLLNMINKTKSKPIAQS